MSLDCLNVDDSWQKSSDSKYELYSTRGESPHPGVIEYYVVSTSPHVCGSWSQIYSLYSDKYDDREDDDHKDDYDHDEDGHDGEDEVSDLFPLL